MKSLTEIVERLPNLIAVEAETDVVGDVKRRKLHELKVPVGGAGEAGDVVGAYSIFGYLVFDQREDLHLVHL
jgi:hypothetical protein